MGRGREKEKDKEEEGVVGVDVISVEGESGIEVVCESFGAREEEGREGRGGRGRRGGRGGG